MTTRIAIVAGTAVALACVVLVSVVSGDDTEHDAALRETNLKLSRTFDLTARVQLEATIAALESEGTPSPPSGK